MTPLKHSVPAPAASGQRLKVGGLLVLVLVVASWAANLIPSTARADGRADCQTLAADHPITDRSGEALIWADFSTYFACRYTSPGVLTLTRPFASSSGTETPDGAAAAGHWGFVRVAYYGREGTPGSPDFWMLSVFDLRRTPSPSGRQARVAWTADTQDLRCAVTPTDLAVNGRGGAAWAGTGGVVAFRPGRRARRLTRSKVDPGSLRLAPDAATWTQAGLPHRAPLGSEPRQDDPCR